MLLSVGNVTWRNLNLRTFHQNLHFKKKKSVTSLDPSRRRYFTIDLNIIKKKLVPWVQLIKNI